MKSNTSVRLKQIMNERNLKQVDILRMSEPFQKQLEIKMGKSTLSQYVSGKQSPDQDRIYLLSKTLDINEPWLMGFDVPKKRIPDEQRGAEDNSLDISTIYNQLETKRQERVYNFAQKQLDKQQSKIIHLEAYQEIEIQSKLSAGTGIVDLDPQHTDTISYYGHVPDEYDVAFEVSGDSMEPLFEDGEIVFVQYTEDIINGQIAVVQINDEAYIKKVYIEDDHLRLVSLNKNYKDITSDNGDTIRFVGRVIV